MQAAAAVRGAVTFKFVGSAAILPDGPGPIPGLLLDPVYQHQQFLSDLLQLEENALVGEPDHAEPEPLELLRKIGRAHV